MANTVITPGATGPPNTEVNDKLRKSQHNQDNLRKRLSTTSKFSQRELSAFEVDTKEGFKQLWHTTIAAQSGFDARHDRGVAKIAGKVTKLTNRVAVAWSDIAPILDILSNVGRPYSGIAIGTIAFAFMVARNRQKMESRVGATLKSIQDRLPGIETYQRIYQNNGQTDEQLKATIIDAYDCFIEFCIETVTFFTMSSFCELLPKHYQVESKLQAEIYMSQLAGNVADILRLNEKQARQIEDLSGQVETEELQRGHDGQKLERIGKLLKLEPYSSETERTRLSEYRGNIMAEYNGWYSLQETPKTPLASITNHQTFQSWRTSVSSRILLLIGHFITECAMPEKQDPFTFYIIGARTVDDTFNNVASSLIFRLLSMNPDALRNEEQYAELQAELQSYENSTLIRSNPYIVQESLAKVALRVLNMFPSSTTVWIILERLDQCRDEESTNLHRKMLLKFLVRLVEDENLSPRVRVLAAVSSVDWRIEDQQDEMDQTKKDSVVFWSLEQAGHK
ncbi:hypothetical protein GQX73_g4652 [Xylaria multiplex]|uniref:DUF7708 domain-containing protein n=1 Tax=Xylaria multiplex TaxID=323545 RepID=A0A7C8J1T4_9PEZI|nr:hypothetical protein GQX73_g4652 [Xylaria multiplex]